MISISHIRGELKRRVFHAIEACGRRGATCDELEETTDLKHQTLSARVRELWQEGWINRVGEQRRTRSGRWAVVYRVRKRRKPRQRRARCGSCGQVLQ